MSVAENVFVGRELTSAWGMVNHRQMVEETQKIIDSLEIKLSAQEAVENLSVAEQQFVKILRALALEPQVLIMDEPTAVFNVKDAQMVLDLARSISKRGIGIIYISHRLEEIIDLADRITVFKDGKKVACHNNREEKIDITTITKEMVGREINLFYRQKRKTLGKPLLEVKDLCLSENSPFISFSLHEGEILGVAGLVGSGRTEIMKALFGAGKKYSGEIFYRGEKININSPQEAIKIGMGFITEDRQKTGLALGLSIIKNITLPSLDDLFAGYLIFSSSRSPDSRKICPAIGYQNSIFRAGSKVLKRRKPAKSSFSPLAFERSRNHHF
jgi:ABC-type sugar transport system ATPase subunit